MQVERRDLTVTQGAVFTFEHRWAVDRVPQSLANTVVRMGVASRPGQPLIVDVSSETGGVEIEPNGVTGLYRVTLSSAETSKFRRPCQFDVVVIKSPTEAYRVLQGTISVDRGVTPTIGEVL